MLHCSKTQVSIQSFFYFTCKCIYKEFLRKLLCKLPLLKLFNPSHMLTLFRERHGEVDSTSWEHPIKESIHWNNSCSEMSDDPGWPRERLPVCGAEGETSWNTAYLWRGHDSGGPSLCPDGSRHQISRLWWVHRWSQQQNRREPHLSWWWLWPQPVSSLD